ncbi:8-oxo-dGTP diphosphatase MutT [Pelagibaculum spongiae]|uniref:8-oxo-dGTP diphosphatase n=1 Tax=Pelagibaculum spongiae TaxID=2080658 RepID=A0A2V1H607_9GAMM|nr:8-oxo-dGTP diphosphatase MutT [Pelagibaculum spongiae]PVZ71862.1 8-oxo-dGTP diphosphatase MutT [Pelagibaculum spongiae]
MLQVVAGIIRRAGKVCICRRPSDKHEGDKWEFPGGKIEPGETHQEALYRELDEEVGIQIGQAEPLCRLVYRYPEKTVCLNFMVIDHFSNEPWGKEGQPLQWVDQNDLASFTFPKANFPVIKVLSLPQQCRVVSAEQITENILSGSAQNADLLCLQRGRQTIVEYAETAANLLSNLPCADHLLVDDFALAQQLACGYFGGISDSMHDGKKILLAQICSNASQIEKAINAKADVLLLDKITDSSESISQLMDFCSLPVYLQAANIVQAKRLGAKGVILREQMND